MGEIDQSLAAGRIGRRWPTMRDVIPAKAGIHPSTGAMRQDGSRLSPG
ncbi:MAG: hypothetical protein U1E53_31805 [Dongiaceae bacterium]